VPRPFALAVAAIAALHGAAVLAIWLGSEPSGARPSHVTAAADASVPAPRPFPELLPDPDAPAVPLPNVAPTIPGGPIVEALPKDADARKEALLALRRRKLADRDEAHRRGAARGGRSFAPPTAPVPLRPQGTTPPDDAGAPVE
jgi:hypothetical protein